ncbi:GNAT family N-acetyltransferase [Pseudoroseicyclus sp. CXY001]|uniref:GNAT family N-acetyltransferase n=1 Tax=Pseudoroseicyclus sp. CXY001 TaxID=3242492 RepID=UPI0035711538
MSAVTLAPLPRAQGAAVQHLEVPEPQLSFVAPIRQMLGEERESVEFHKVLAGAEAVGFFKIDRAYGQDSGFAGPKDTGLRGFLIGGQYQGRGYGRAALEALPAYLRETYPGLALVRLTVNHQNPVARRLYLATGWRETGLVWRGGRHGPQDVLALDL